MSQTADPDWDTVGFVTSSSYRVDVLRVLQNSPATPSTIASRTDRGITHISRALGELRDRGLVELLVAEDRKKGRIYGITDTGSQAASTIAELNGGGA